MPTTVPYIGKAEYCYANSTSMLLASVDEEISARTIEVLTGVGLGAFASTSNHNLYFSNFSAPPDLGIDRALQLLGFEFEHRSFDSPDESPLESLKDDLRSGPVVIGPVDMGLLTYNPRATGAIGADHYIVVTGFDGDTFFLNDPVGIPYAWLSGDELIEAWKAELVGYKRSHFQSWSRPRRVAHHTERELFESAIRMFKGIYDSSIETVSHAEVLTGPDAIAATARRVTDGLLSEGERGFLLDFMLPVSAARASDYAGFFAKHDETLSSLKAEMAELFGAARMHLHLDDTDALATSLRHIGDVEAAFESRLRSLSPFDQRD